MLFIYYDGAHLYHLPATHVEINPDPKALYEIIHTIE